MAAADVILVNVRSFKDSTTIYSEPVLIPTYIVRDHVQYYGKYQNIKGGVSETLTAVTFTIPTISTIPGPRITVDLIVELPLADFNTLMTT